MKSTLKLKIKQPSDSVTIKFFAVLLNFAFPGVGFLLLGRKIVCIIMMILVNILFISMLLASIKFNNIFFILYFIFGFAIMLIYTTKIKIRTIEYSLLLYIVISTITFSLGFTFGVCADFFIGDFIYTYGSSMEPTLYGKNHEAIDKLTYLYREPSRGDIVKISGMIKRIVGQPGDTIHFKNEKVFINDINFTINRDSDWYINRVYREGEDFHLQKGEYFLLGDNLEASKDSRQMGLFHRRSIYGKLNAH